LKKHFGSLVEIDKAIIRIQNKNRIGQASQNLRHADAQVVIDIMVMVQICGLIRRI
jgi:hypothetical protein